MQLKESGGACVESSPLIVQRDLTMLLDVGHPQSATVRNALLQFAEIVKCPEFVHIYKLSRLTLWNAAANGWTSGAVCAVLDRYSRYPVADSVKSWIHQEMKKYGVLILLEAKESDSLILTGDPYIMDQLGQSSSIAELVQYRQGEWIIAANNRGNIKRACIKLGYPVVDKAGYRDGVHCRMAWDVDPSFSLRPYQTEALEHFFTGDGNGSGVIVLPCGSGKTILGIAAMLRLCMHTLILTPNTTSAEQWYREIMKRTTLTEQQVGFYTAVSKQIAPVTITTYQMLIQRNKGDLVHFNSLSMQPWGLVIYDEVHLLPAPVFRLSADLQSRRRLGLTATLIREDGAEEEVFVLVGPKKYDAPWKAIEQDGWIAPTKCIEVTVPFSDDDKIAYYQASKRQQHRLAAENSRKLSALEALLKRHEQDQVLVIGQYLDQLNCVAKRLQAPIITGKTSQKERNELYERFRNGDIRSLIVSKVANVAVDLPDANVAIQLSGSFGSRQEEAQRIGRILRPNANGKESYFYSIVTKSSVEQDSAWNRQLFLTEQGYQYELLDFTELSKEVEA
jgi:DNA excision repair protein ERCC-3